MLTCLGGTAMLKDLQVRCLAVIVQSKVLHKSVRLTWKVLAFPVRQAAKACDSVRACIKLASDQQVGYCTVQTLLASNWLVLLYHNLHPAFPWSAFAPSPGKAPA